MNETGIERRRGTHDIKSLAALLNSQAMLQQIGRAVRTGVDPTTVARIALTAVQRNPKLLECTERSLLGALLECVQVGLEPNVMGQAYLVPFRDHGVMVATLIIGWRGYVQLAYRSKMVAAPFAINVYSNERYRVSLGSNPTIEHEPLPPSKRGDWVATYATAKIVGGGEVASLWMWREEVEAIRKRSRAADDGPWVTDTEEMQKKTAFRRLAKWLPLSPEFARAVEVDEEAETGRVQSFVDIGPVESLELGSKTERLTEALQRQSAAAAPSPDPPPAPPNETMTGPATLCTEDQYRDVRNAWPKLHEDQKEAFRKRFKFALLPDVKRLTGEIAGQLISELEAAVTAREKK